MTPEAFPSPPSVPRCQHCAARLDVMHQPGCPAAPTPKVYERLRELERAAADADRAPEAVGEILDELTKFFTSKGARLASDTQEALQKAAQRHDNLIIRREDPRALFQALETDQAIPVHFRSDAHGGEPYPNAAVLGSGLEGLRIPYQRGFGKMETGRVVFMVGFTPSENMSVQLLPEDAYHHYAGSDRSRVRMVDGDVSRSDIRFLLVRFPRQGFPADRMTAQEIEHEEVAHISRLFAFE